MTGEIDEDLDGGVTVAELEEEDDIYIRILQLPRISVTG